MKKMDWREFEAALDQYGADWSSWPEAASKAARELLEQDERARRSWQAAVLVEQALNEALPPVEPSAALMRRLAMIPIEQPQAKRSFWIGGWWQPVAVALLAGAMGVFVGSVEPSDEAAEAAPSESAPALEEANDWALVELAFADDYLEDWL